MNDQERQAFVELVRQVDRYEALLVNIYRDIQGERGYFWLLCDIRQTAPEVEQIAKERVKV